MTGLGTFLAVFKEDVNEIKHEIIKPASTAETAKSFKKDDDSTKVPATTEEKDAEKTDTEKVVAEKNDTEKDDTKKIDAEKVVPKKDSDAAKITATTESAKLDTQSTSTTKKESALVPSVAIKPETKKTDTKKFQLISDEKAKEAAKDVKYENIKFEYSESFDSANVGIDGSTDGDYSSDYYYDKRCFYSFGDNSRFYIYVGNHKKDATPENIEALRKMAAEPATGKIKNFKVIKLDDNTYIRTFTDIEAREDVVIKYLITIDRYDKVSIHKFKFRYDVEKVTDKTKAIVQHMIDSFKPAPTD